MVVPIKSDVGEVEVVKERVLGFFRSQERSGLLIVVCETLSNVFDKIHMAVWSTEYSPRFKGDSRARWVEINAWLLL